MKKKDIKQQELTQIERLNQLGMTAKGVDVVDLSDANLAMMIGDEKMNRHVEARTLGVRSFEDSLLAMREWTKYDAELNYLVWHGPSSYFPLATLPPKASTNIESFCAKRGDVACHCGCGQEYLNMDLYNRLTHARVIAGVPFNVSSWNRCKEHNKSEGGSETSSHLLGYAVDIKLTQNKHTNHYCHTIVTALLEVGFTRIGIYSWGIHVDVDPNKTKEVIWRGNYSTPKS